MLVRELNHYGTLEAAPLSIRLTQNDGYAPLTVGITIEGISPEEVSYGVITVEDPYGIFKTRQWINTLSATYTFDYAGTYAIHYYVQRRSVTGLDLGAQSVSTTVTVRSNTVSVPSSNFQAKIVSSIYGSTIDFYLQVINGQINPYSIVSWQFGDGTSESTDGEHLVVTHTYSSPSTYRVTATFRDIDDQWHTVETIVQPQFSSEPVQPVTPIEPVPPVIPIEPVQPVEPVIPYEPVEPIIPVIPDQPVEPVSPLPTPVPPPDSPVPTPSPLPPEPVEPVPEQTPKNTTKTVLIALAGLSLFAFLRKQQ